MSRKHYALIASVLRRELEIAEGFDEEHGAAALRELSTKLADALAADNPRFNRERFIAACGLEELHYTKGIGSGATHIGPQAVS